VVPPPPHGPLSHQRAEGSEAPLLSGAHTCGASEMRWRRRSPGWQSRLSSNPPRSDKPVSILITHPADRAERLEKLWLVGSRPRPAPGSSVRSSAPAVRRPSAAGTPALLQRRHRRRRTRRGSNAAARSGAAGPRGRSMPDRGRRHITFCLLRYTSPHLNRDHTQRVVNPSERRRLARLDDLELAS